MSSSTSTRPRPTATKDPRTLTHVAQAFAVLTVLNELYMFLTAGRLFPDGGPEVAHADGAIPLHVVAGVAAVAVFLRRRAVGGPVWPLVLAVVVFVDTFVQALTGGREHLALHVPGAMVLTVGSAWLAVWALQLRSRPAAAA